MFDTIDHYKLLQKLSEYGDRGFALEWFKSYPTNKARCVKLGDCLSHVDVNIFAGFCFRITVIGPLYK